MCHRCVDAVKRIYPDLPADKYGEFLMGTTAFPFGDARSVSQQLSMVKRNTDGSIEEAYGYADLMLDYAMAGFDPIQMGI